MSSYKDYFYFGKSYADHTLYRETVKGFLENKKGIESIQSIIKSRFNEGIIKVSDELKEDVESLTSEMTYSMNNINNTLNDGFKNLGNIIENCSGDIVNSIDDLRYHLGMDLSEVKWAIERQTEYSKEILKVMITSLDNESKQYYNQGVKSYDNSEFEIAKDRFKLALERDKTNFFAYQYLGFISVEENNQNDAERYFNLAYKFSDNKYYKALALINLARHYYSINNNDLAMNFSENATTLYPDSAEFWYKRALYSTLNTKDEEAIRCLNEAIIRDWKFWSVVLVDDEFKSIKTNIIKLLNALREEKLNQALEKLNELQNVIKTAENTGCKDDIEPIKLFYKETLNRCQHPNIYELLDIIRNAPVKTDECFELTEKKIINDIALDKKKINYIESEIRKKKNELDTKKSELDSQKLNSLGRKYHIYSYSGCLTMSIIWILSFILIVGMFLTPEGNTIYTKFNLSPISVFLITFGIPTLLSLSIHFLIKLSRYRKEKTNIKYESSVLNWHKNALHTISEPILVIIKKLENEIVELREKIKIYEFALNEVKNKKIIKEPLIM